MSLNIEAAFRRMDRVMISIAVAGTVVAFGWLGWQAAVAFGFGGAVSILNFKWMKGAVDLVASKFAASANSTAEAESRPPAEDVERPKRVAVKFIVRYALLGAVGYGI